MEKEMTHWMSIHHAPKDGTHVDLLDADDGEIVRGVYWGEPDDVDEDDAFGEGWLRNVEYALEEGSLPTHWRIASKPD